MSKRTIIFVVAAFGAVLFLAATAQAQMLIGGVEAALVIPQGDYDENDFDSGAGIEPYIGFNMNQYLDIIASVMLTKLEGKYDNSATSVIPQATLRVKVPVTERFKSYLQGGLAYASTDFDIEIEGVDEARTENSFGFALGAGVNYALTEHFSIGGKYKYYNLNDYEIEGEEFDGSLSSLAAVVEYLF